MAASAERNAPRAAARPDDTPRGTFSERLGERIAQIENVLDGLRADVERHSGELDVLKRPSAAVLSDRLQRKEAAGEIGKSLATLDRLIRRREIEAVRHEKSGRVKLIRRAEIERYKASPGTGGRR
jgi:hypothetical protein